ncbi:hypothetical protein ADK65_07620 [Streptomyces sp. NRRL B-1140]|nr:hypothetical protein ADK65_07620 [Streptomyces sp. NRRL B-1140]
MLGLVQCGFEGGQDGVVAAVLGEPLVERAGRAVQRHLLVEGLGHELHEKYLGGDVRVFAQSLLVPVAGGTDPAEGALRAVGLFDLLAELVVDVGLDGGPVCLG